MPEKMCFSMHQKSENEVFWKAKKSEIRLKSELLQDNKESREITDSIHINSKHPLGCHKLNSGQSVLL